MEIPYGKLPVAKSTFGKILVSEISPPVNVTLKGFALEAINPVAVFKTVIGW